ncbi:carboxypeptidase regulatory-like domain-containing protein [Pedobacter sp. UBA4863]|uniref:carboxypeptidase regulatory-like domain-containing protein n=1 Tax=Pedobacter sp. UBA4863 TaxID=1947060 RepID=UPI0025EF3BAD|nr:carboxypeptidase regulatory-like domain-containing protein [Pedobacter sp. UBA4863]
MKITIALLLLLTVLSCKKDKRSTKEGEVKGLVSNDFGVPLSHATIIIDHDIFFNTTIRTKTGSDGKYLLKVPHGSWYAFAIFEKEYRGKRYKFYLHPNDNASFGGEGAERNFTWKLTGEKASPLSGFYGGLITIDNYPGVYIDKADIEFKLVPQGKLIDDTEGSILILKAADGYQLKDIPIGTYKITAKYRGEILKLRKWNTEDDFVNELLLDFEPQIDGQCDNCFKIEYNQ